VAQFDGRAFFAGVLKALNARDFAEIRRLVHDDVVSSSPQSGERAQGIEAFLAEGESYPGGTPEVEEESAKILVEDDRWMITPSYTVVPMASPSSYTAVMKVRYPDGTNWLTVLLVELRDEKIASVEAYYAPEMPAPILASIGRAPEPS
jgi:hypothetical protein